jgi:hypothetical protein
VVDCTFPDPFEALEERGGMRLSKLTSGRLVDPFVSRFFLLNQMHSAAASSQDAHTGRVPEHRFRFSLQRAHANELRLSFLPRPVDCSVDMMA